MKIDKEFNVSDVHNALMVSVYDVLGAPNDKIIQKLQFWVTYLPVRWCSRLFMQLDKMVAVSGISPASRWFLKRFIKDLRIFGQENIPYTGPLIVASNHPGAYDSFCLVAAIERKDLSLVVSDIPFLKILPHINPHLIFLSKDDSSRMLSIRNTINHIQQGGAFLIFPTDWSIQILRSRQDQKTSWIAAGRVVWSHFLFEFQKRR